jgi:hypothetical protein
MLCSSPISAAEAAKDDYYGIGDSRDHNDMRYFSDAPENQIRHCLTFHELYDHIRIPMKHMGRIGHVSTDIAVTHQNDIRIDLTTEHTTVVQDEAYLRENFTEKLQE